MKPSTISRSAAICAAAVLLAACASSSSSSSSGSANGNGSSSGPVTYGVLSCFTGRLASLGQAMLQGSQVAMNEINSAGGVLGRHVQLVTGDTGCDVADGVTATNQMLTKNVSGVIGPETQEINGVEPILDANHIVDEFQGGDTARDHQTDPYFFRDSPSDSQLGVAMALYGHLQGYTRAVMLFYSDPAAQTFLKPVSQTFTKLGGTIVKTVIVTPDQTSYLSQVQEVIAAHPQVIFTQEDPPTAAVLFREFKQLGGGSIPWIGTDVTSGSDYITAITKPTAHAVLTSVYGTSVTGAANTAFINLFNQLFPTQKTAGPLANANYAYDAVISLALADDYAKTTDGTTVAHDMTKVTNPPGTACYTYASCLALIKAGTKINYEGASGDLDYNTYNNTFGPYGAFKVNAAGVEQQAYVMSATALAAATPTRVDATAAGTGRYAMAGPLAGVHVLDLSRVLAGPYAAMLLGDLGAEVIKVERPGAGDDTRHWGPPFVQAGTGTTSDGAAGDGAESTYFLSVNRGKRSVAIDLKDPGEREFVEALVRWADVLVENFRPGVMDRLGLADDRLAELNPRLIRLSISGFGERGPDRDRVGYDQILQAEGGVMSLTGTAASRAVKVGVPIADVGAALFGVIGVLGALVERERSGLGQRVTTSLLAGQVGIHTFQATRYLIAGQVPGLSGNHHPTVAPYGVFDAADGPLVIAVGNDDIWRRFAPLAGLDPADPRFATNALRLGHLAELQQIMNAALGQRPVADWLDRMRLAGVPAGELKTLDRVYDSEQARAEDLVWEVDHPRLGGLRLPGHPVHYSRSAVRPGLPPPALGEHTDELRAALLDPAQADGS